jgi:molybdopterin synthase catalytic subunit
MASPAVPHKDFVKITPDIISLDEVAKLVHDPKAGAVSTFSGMTRDNFEGKAASLALPFIHSCCYQDVPRTTAELVFLTD